MSETIEVKVPNIGDFSEVEVIEVLVKPGDRIAAEQSLITVESDKASMEIPSSVAGVVKTVQVKVGDKVSEGSLVLVLEGEAAGGAAGGQAGAPAAAASSAPAASAAPSRASTPAPSPAPSPAPASGSKASTAAAPAPAPASSASKPTAASAPAGGEGAMQTVTVPDIGDFDQVEVIEVLVKAGDEVKAEQSLITVESDKASMEIPSPTAGVIKALLVKLGDKVSKGSPIAQIAGGGASAAAAPASAAEAAEPASKAAKPVAESDTPQSATAAGAAPASTPASAPTPPSAVPAQAASGAPAASPSPARTPPGGIGEAPEHVVKPHASPSVRKFARELGVDLALVSGSGPKQRILHDDVREFVKGLTSAAASSAARGAPAGGPAGDGGAGLGLIPWPKVDFEKFGPVQSQPIARIRKISAANLHRNWVMIPHVTNHEDADITELEAFRVQLNRENEKGGVKVTLLAFLIKACAAALKKFPEFNSSLDGENLILKHYYHIGFAADTPNGLVVPVVRDADTKGILEIAKETAELAARAREGKLSPGQMQGGTFSISSLGGIGGTYFTPIINAPEVAILGVCRSQMRPMWDGKAFQPRLMLPLSLSWDHRVLDGAAAGRFNAFLAQLLADFRRVML